MGKLIVPLIIGLLMGVSGGGFFSVYQAGKAHASAVADAQKRGLKPASDSTHAATDSAGISDTTAAHGGGDHTATEPSTAEPTTATAAAPAAAAAHAPAAHAPAAQATETHTPVVTKPSATPAIAAPVAPAKQGAPPNDDAATAAATQAHQRRLAKIFATMGPKDAARVLGQMNDHDVGIILGLLSDRQTAAILTNLPAPRAAALSQVQPRRTGGEK